MSIIHWTFFFSWNSKVGTESDATLIDNDTNATVDDGRKGMAMQNCMKKKISAYISEERKKGADFVIARMDPIEYKHDNKKFVPLLR